MLEAEDQLLVQFDPLNRAAKGPLRKLCMSEAEIVEVCGSVGAKPNVFSNAVSMALCAADAGVEK